jgi:hypothetical protein
MVIGSLTGCQSSGEIEASIKSKVAKNLTDMTAAAVTDWNREIGRLDTELAAAQQKLIKVEQVAEPALKWVGQMKADAQMYLWNARILEVTDELNTMKNDQYKVAKLQFTAEMLSAGMRYSSVIMIDDLISGKTTVYEELRDTLKSQVVTLSQQKEAKSKIRDMAQSTVANLPGQAVNWKVQKINSITYTISGPGLGMETGPAVGLWTYSTDTDKLTPTDTAAFALQKVLTGK